MPLWRVGRRFDCGLWCGAHPLAFLKSKVVRCIKMTVLKKKKGGAKRESSILLLTSMEAVTLQSQFPGEESSPPCPISRK